MVLSSEPGWGSHPYHLTLAVCPTKNNDRYEWFAEKATELGVDRIVPVIGDRSERKVFKTDRLRKIVLSATKQSLKARLPQVEEPTGVKEFIAHADPDALRLIAYCFEDEGHPRISIKEALSAFAGDRVEILIGPEGDFSPEEARLALDSGFVPVHLGASRLRTETAAVTAAEAVYFKYL
jgi:16S rRNA (uracil1498-N3)-methyltransferase